MRLWPSIFKAARGNQNSIVAAAFVSALTLLAACGGDDGEEAADVDLKTFDGIFTSYLSKCEECHRPGADAFENFVPGLDFTSADLAYTALIGLVKIKRNDECASRKYIGTTSKSSFLVAILDKNVNEGFPEATNSDCTPLNHTIANGGVAKNPSSEELSGIKSWISSGAKR